MLRKNEPFLVSNDFSREKHFHFLHLFIKLQNEKTVFNLIEN